jgi:hypothetical protein
MPGGHAVRSSPPTAGSHLGDLSARGRGHPPPGCRWWVAEDTRHSRKLLLPPGRAPAAAVVPVRMSGPGAARAVLAAPRPGGRRRAGDRRRHSPAISDPGAEVVRDSARGRLHGSSDPRAVRCGRGAVGRRAAGRPVPVPRFLPRKGPEAETGCSRAIAGAEWTTVVIRGARVGWAACSRICEPPAAGSRNAVVARELTQDP